VLAFSFFRLALIVFLEFVFIDYDKDRRLDKLLAEIMRTADNKTIIFAETKRKVDDITRTLRRDG
jgi:superfamily II DNA/RNA helicase